jgi:rod shape-determining protein MreC
VSAEVILISDPEHAIPIQVNRTGARTIGLGTGRSGLLSLPYLPQNADVIVGDLLVSSGLGGVYPPGYPVGKVTAVVRDPGQPLLSVEAEPLAGLDREPTPTAGPPAKPAQPPVATTDPPPAPLPAAVPTETRTETPAQAPAEPPPAEATP